MRIASFGWVDEDAGSVASASYVVVQELLRRGHQIDLYADREHIPSPAKLAGVAGFCYIGLPRPAICRVPGRAKQAAEIAAGPAWEVAWRQRYLQAARSRQRAAAYDVLLTLGVAPPFTLAGVPTVTWVQGSSHLELDAIRRLAPTIRRVSGTPFYLALAGYYRVRARRELSLLDPCDEIICGSEWTRRALAGLGVPNEHLHAIAYPVDLQRFCPAHRDIARPPRGPVLLSLGRLDPRKRLDLLLDAFALVVPTVPDCRLRIVGRPGYAPNQLSMLERSPVRDRIDYTPGVARESVPELLRSARVLVQTSENENFASAPAEALACGVPAVVGPSNGTADYLDPRSEVFASYTPQAVADSVLRVVARTTADPAATRASTRASAERWFSTSAVVDAVEDVLQRAVRARPGATVNPPR